MFNGAAVAILYIAAREQRSLMCGLLIFEVPSSFPFCARVASTRAVKNVKALPGNARREHEGHNTSAVVRETMVVLARAVYPCRLPSLCYLHLHAATLLRQRGEEGSQAWAADARAPPGGP